MANDNESKFTCSFCILLKFNFCQCFVTQCEWLCGKRETRKWKESQATACLPQVFCTAAPLRWKRVSGDPLSVLVSILWSINYISLHHWIQRERRQKREQPQTSQLHQTPLTGSVTHCDTTLYFPKHAQTCSSMLLVVLTMRSCFSSQSKCFRLLRDTEKLDETKKHS